MKLSIIVIFLALSAVQITYAIGLRGIDRGADVEAIGSLIPLSISGESSELQESSNKQTAESLMARPPRRRMPPRVRMVAGISSQPMRTIPTQRITCNVGKRLISEIDKINATSKSIPGVDLMQQRMKNMQMPSISLPSQILKSVPSMGSSILHKLSTGSSILGVGSNVPSIPSILSTGSGLPSIPGFPCLPGISSLTIPSTHSFMDSGMKKRSADQIAETFQVNNDNESVSPSGSLSPS